MIASRILAYATALTLTLSGLSAQACERPGDAGIWEKALLTWVNSERKALGVAPLRRSGKLDKAARFHGCDMADNGYFAHSRSGAPKLAERVKTAGYNFRFAGENLAFSRQPDPGTVATIWRKSAAHWDTMIDPKYKEAGIAIVFGSDKYYWVMDVGTQK
jgi:uncharacterized protein YkwD